MYSFLLAAAEESEHATRDIGINPYGYGAIALGFLLILVFGLLQFGKGREHS